MTENRYSDLNPFNHFELVNSDPELSELKYHFLLKKIQIPDGNFSELESSFHRGFRGTKLQKGDICNIKIVNHHGKNLYDLIVGLRKDNEALAIYSFSRIFALEGRQAEIELVEAFRVILEARGQIHSAEEQPSNKSKQQPIYKRSPKIREIEQQNREQSRSRSRQNERTAYKKREQWADRIFGVFYPQDWTKQSFTTLLTDNLRCARNQILVESQTIETLPCFVISIRTQTIINNLLAGIRSTEGVVLLLKESQVIERGLLRSIKQRQLKAIRTSLTRSDNPLYQLCKALISFKDFNLRVVTVAPHQENFIVVIQNRVLGVFNFLRIAGWKFQTVGECVRLPAAATEQWHKFLNIYKV